MQPQQQREREQPRQPDGVVVIRANERKRRVIPNATSDYEDLAPPGVRALAMFQMTAEAGKGTAAGLKHGGDECFLLLSGKHEVEVEGKRYTLEPGDTIFIPRGLVHRGWNGGADRVDSIFVLSPPEYVEQEKEKGRPQGEAVVVRASERKRWAVPPRVTSTYEELSPPGVASILLLDVRMEPGPTFMEPVRHGGDENLVMVSGRVELEVEDAKYLLGPGDSVFTPRGKRHRITTSLGSETAEAVFAICPARYEL